MNHMISRFLDDHTVGRGQTMFLFYTEAHA
jgi:hypothetical protein